MPGPGRARCSRDGQRLSWRYGRQPVPALARPSENEERQPGRGRAAVRACCPGRLEAAGPAEAAAALDEGPGSASIHAPGTRAEIVTELGETLRQTPVGVALTGDGALRTGPMRSLGYRWFTDPATRLLYAPEDHGLLSRIYASALREIATRRGPGSRASSYVDLLLAESDEFRRLWSDHEVGPRDGSDIDGLLGPHCGPE